MKSDSLDVKGLASWSAYLACPACHQALRLEDARVICNGCGCAYPIIDGIPVLIVEQAATAAT